jgi:hypothetical protein
MSEKQTLDAHNTAKVVPLPLPIDIDDELLDWDARIETPPPPRRSGTIQVTLRRIGRGKPIPMADPEDHS